MYYYPSKSNLNPWSFDRDVEVVQDVNVIPRFIDSKYVTTFKLIEYNLSILYNIHSRFDQFQTKSVHFSSEFPF